MEYQQIVTFVTVAFALMGGVVTVDKVLDIIAKHKKPSEDINKSVLDHERRITTLEKKVHDSNKIQNRALLQIMNHMLDGNHTEQLREVRNDMEDYLINK